MASIEGRWIARFVLAISAEFIFIAGRTWIVHHWPAGVMQELAWSAWRLPFIAIYWSLFRAFIFSTPARPIARNPLLYAAIAFLLVAIPVDARPSDWGYRLLLAVTSPIVGLREELFYRVIVQGFLEQVLGPMRALLLASAIFVAYHYGAQPLTPWAIGGIFAFGVLLGVIYQRTRNLWLVAALHAAVDFIWPLIPQVPIPIGIALTADVLAVIWALVWWRADRDAGKSKAT